MAVIVGIAEQEGLLPFLRDEDAAKPDVDAAGLKRGRTGRRFVGLDFQRPFLAGGKAFQQLDFKTLPIVSDLVSQGRRTRGTSCENRRSFPINRNFRHTGRFFTRHVHPAVIYLLILAAGTQVGQESVEPIGQRHLIFPKNQAAGEGFRAADDQLNAVAALIGRRQDDFIVLEHVGFSGNKGCDAVRGVVEAEQFDILSLGQVKIINAAGQDDNPFTRQVILALEREALLLPAAGRSQQKPQGQ